MQIIKNYIKKMLDKFYENKYRNIVLFSLLILIFILNSIIFNWNKKVCTLVIILFGLATKIFAQVVILIGLIPIVGPFVAQILSWPLFFTLNIIAYLVTLITVKSGGKKDIINTKILVTIFLIGVIIGIIIGNLL